MADIEMIDDAYWLKFAKDHVTNAITARDDAANKLDTFLTAVWGLYTTAFTVAVIIGAITNDSFYRFIMASPVIIIPLAKFFCVQVQLPVPVNFFANIPESIEQDGYATIIRKKNFYMIIARIMTFISALSIGVALFVYKMNDYKPPKDEASKSYHVTAGYNKDCKCIRLVGTCQPNKTLSLSVAGTDSSGKVWHYVEVSQVKCNDKGEFDTVVNSNDAATNFKIFMSWPDDNNQVKTVKN